MFYADIERAYGQRKLVAQRTPVFVQPRKSGAPQSAASTPATTEGDTATESELETETEGEYSPVTGSATRTAGAEENKPVSHHDLLTKYFRRDPVIFHNIDWCR